jgi:type IV secretion system protein VirB1
MVDFVALAQECAPWVAPQTMAAIVKTESAFRPLAIGINGGAKLVRQPENKAEAVATAKWLIDNRYNIDMGLGQVNSDNLPRIGLSVEDAFDPCRNLAAAATILHQNYKRARAVHPTEQGALQAALSAYNTGSMTRGFSNGYVQRVVANGNALDGVSVPAVAPIPLAAGRGQAQPARAAAAKAKGEPRASHGVVQLSRDSDATPAQAGASIYQSGADQSVMVYR